MNAPIAPTPRPVLLVPFDGSSPAEAVFPFVSALAGAAGAVVLLQVVPETRAVHGPLGEIFSAAELQRSAEAGAATDLERAEANLRARAPRLRIAHEIARGEPAEQIVAVAARRQAEMILLATQGQSATGRQGFSSLVGRVAGTSPVPVMLVQPRFGMPGADEVGRFLVAYDGSERAARVLPLVHALADRLSAPVHLVSVVEDEETALPARELLDPRRRVAAQADVLNRARHRLEASGATFLRRGIAASWRVLAGPAAAAILGACEPRDVLTITSHGRTGSRWVLGSVAEKLVRESPVPVILLRTPPDERPGWPP